MLVHAGIRPRARIQLLASLTLAVFLCQAAEAQIVRSDNSPVCNTYLPQCEAKCKRGEAYIFVCSAGNGPQGGPYIICRCAAPFTPVGPPQQSKCMPRDVQDCRLGGTTMHVGVCHPTQQHHLSLLQQ